MSNMPAIESVALLYGDTFRILEANVRHTVALVDEATVVEAPTHAEVAAQDRFKLAALQQLSQAEEPSPLAIPVNPQMDESRPHFTYDYIPGHTTVDEEVASLPADAQVRIGQKVAEFALWFGGALDLATFKEQLLPLKKEYLWDEGLVDLLASFDFGDYPSLTRRANRLGALLGRRYPDGIHEVSAVVHDNLNAQNIILDDDATPVGIVGMSYITPGDLAREGRQMCRFSATVVDAYVQRIGELTGSEVDVEHIRTWATTGHTLALCRRVIQNSDFGSHWFKNARAHMREWYPDEDWSELDGKG